MTFKFYKYQALGNDMIVIDPHHFPSELTVDIVSLLCDRHFGIGADGICYGPLTQEGSQYEMRFFNPDGSEAEKSGNGLRIFARYLWDSGYTTDDFFQIVINDEEADVQILDEEASRLAIGMGRLSFHSQDIPVRGKPREVVGEEVGLGEDHQFITAVSVGNPHCVLFQNDPNLIHTIGPQLEKHPLFPNRTNVQIVQVRSENEIQIAIWERGVGYTLASGSSACAAAAAAVLHGFCRSPVTVHMAGGSAEVIIDNEWRATLIGEVEAVYTGTLSPNLNTALAALS